MNKRIYELAKEADEYADATLSPGEFHPDWHDVRDEKFAKLIVQECVAAEKDKEIQKLRDEIEHLRDLLAVAYQMAGAVGAPVKYLDAFAYYTGNLYNLLPVDLDSFDLPEN